MKRQFPGYYRPRDEEFSKKFQECVFCFDTNALLNLYRYTPESRDNLIKVLQAFKDRVWIPHQVGLEYHRRRVGVLLEQLGLCDQVEEILDKSNEQLEKLQRSGLFAVNAIIGPVKQNLKTIKKKLQRKKEPKPNLMSGDPVCDALTELFDGKVGSPYKEEQYKEIYKKGKERYDTKVPPGYMDKSSNQTDVDQYGDLALWLQLLDYAKTEARPIILVTDDAKEDWWREVKGEKLGPRPELISEFMAATGGSKWFYMYSTEQFLRYSKAYLDADVQPSVIKEAEGIQKHDAEQEKIRMTGVDLQEAQDAAVEAITQARAINSDRIRETLAGVHSSAEAIRNALALPNEEILRAFTQTARSSEAIRNALALPNEEILRAFTQTARSSEAIRNALAQPNEEILRAFTRTSEAVIAACAFGAMGKIPQRKKGQVASRINQREEGAVDVSQEQEGKIESPEPSSASAREGGEVES